MSRECPASILEDQVSVFMLFNMASEQACDDRPIDSNGSNLCYTCGSKKSTKLKKSNPSANMCDVRAFVQDQAAKFC